jgi:hypothetical protein
MIGSEIVLTHSGNKSTQSARNILKSLAEFDFSHSPLETTEAEYCLNYFSLRKLALLPALAGKRNSLSARDSE